MAGLAAIRGDRQCGVLVNVLIDTDERLRREGVAAYDAILEPCRECARPVVTAVTAILGVLPIAFGMNAEWPGFHERHAQRS